MKYCILLLVLVLFDNIAISQTASRLRSAIHYGFIISHADDLKLLSANFPYGFSVEYQQMATSQRHWDACNCFHYLGIKFGYTNFGAPATLGEAYTLAGTFEPVLWRNHAWSVNLHSGIGASWLTRIHHPERNALNQFFSARVSFLLFVAPVIQYRLAEHWDIHLALNYNHISNGGQRQPNRGMNFPQVGLGVNYYLNREALPTYSFVEPDGIWHGWLEGGYTLRKTGNNHERRPVFSLAGGMYYPFTHVNAVGAGLEFTDDFSIPHHDSYRKYTIAPFVSHHFLLGKFDFSQRMAYYMVRPDDVQSHRLYQRYVILYNVFGSVQTGISMKVHGHVASNLDLRLAWLF